MSEILDEAMEAFWAVIARHHPEIKTGDLPPGETLAFENSCRMAYDAWLKGNQALDYHLTSGDYDADITLAEFLSANEEALSAEDILAVENMAVGEERQFGGGSAGESVLRRLR